MNKKSSSQPPKVTSILAQRLRELRGNRTLQAVANDTGKDIATISRYEHGQVEPPEDFLMKFCEMAAIQRSELIPRLKIGLAPYSDFAFFYLISRTFVGHYDKPIEPLNTESKKVQYLEIIPLLQRGEIDLCLFPHTWALEESFKGNLANIVMLPVIYSLKINAILATGHALDGTTDGARLQSFGQTYLQTTGRDRRDRHQRALAVTLAQLADERVEFCIANAATARGPILLLRKMTDFAAESLDRDQPDLRDRLLSLAARLDKLCPSESDNTIHRRAELDAVERFAECSTQGKAAIFIGGLAHRIILENHHNAGVLLGNATLQYLSTVMRDSSHLIAPRFSVLVNKDSATRFAKELELLAMRWNAAVDAVAQDRCDYSLINMLVDQQMVSAHSMQPGSSQANGSALSWRAGERIFEAILQQHLLELKRWPTTSLFL